MDVITLEVTPRNTGKKAAKATRRADDVPCVLYGKGVDPVHFQVSELALRPLIFTSDSHIVELKLDDNAWSCIVRSIDFHPVSDRPIHADFLALQEGHKVRMKVPILFSGTAAGVRRGGRIEFVITKLNVECLPKDIPSHIEVDVTDLDFGDALHVRDLTEVPGVTFLDKPERSIVIVMAARDIIEDEADEDEEEGEGLEEGEGEGEGPEETTEAQ